MTTRFRPIKEVNPKACPEPVEGVFLADPVDGWLDDLSRINGCLQTKPPAPVKGIRVFLVSSISSSDFILTET